MVEPLAQVLKFMFTPKPLRTRWPPSSGEVCDTFLGY